MTYSKKLDRIIKKNLTDYDANAETATSTELKLSSTEFQALLTAVDQAFETNETKLQQAERSLEISSRELAETNQQLFNTNITMNTVLNSLEEGLIVFDKTGLCSKFSSAASEKHFSKNFNENTIYYFELFNNNQALQEDIKVWVELLFSGNFDFYQINELGPNWVQNIDDKKIEIHYKPIFNLEKKLDKVLVITRDVTSEIQAKTEADNQKNMAKTIIEICSSPKLFQDMLESVHQMNSEIKKQWLQKQNSWNESEDVIFKRQLHTIKGSTSSFNLKSIVDKIHEYETSYSEIYDTPKKLNLINEITHFIDMSCNHISSQYGFILKKLLDSQSDTSSDLLRKKNEFFTELIQYNNNSLIQSFKEKFILSNFSDLFLQYESVIENFSTQLGKSILPLKIKSDSIFVLSDRYKDLMSSFVHVFKNICDHGIETPEQRINHSKPESGQITIDCKLANNSIHFTISDDGRGISVDTLREKIKGTALEAKYNHSQNLLNCIFEASVTTKTEVTEHSGRGVGLNAVYAELVKLNGQVNVKSEINKGTTFEFQVPLLNTVEIEKFEEFFLKSS